jgi:hypothetical protein
MKYVNLHINKETACHQLSQTPQCALLSVTHSALT